MKVWLVWERADWQGDTLWGAYAAQKIANAVVDEQNHWFIEEVEVFDTPIVNREPSWHGN